MTTLDELKAALEAAHRGGFNIIEVKSRTSLSMMIGDESARC